MHVIRRTTSVILAKVCTLGIVLLLSLLAGSAVPSLAAAGPIAQDYKTTDNNIVPGALVSLTANGVAVAASSAQTTLVGVATSEPTVAVSDNTANNVHIAVSGSATVLVSDVNGSVKPGDRITVSPFSGIGMKATASSNVVGIAQADMRSTQLATRKVTDKYGKTSTIHVGSLPVTIGVGYYTVTSTSGLSAFVPTFLQNLANTISGKQVSPLRVLAGTAAVVLGFLTIMMMLYTSVRGAMVALGRNPLAQSVIRKGLVDVAVTALAVLVVANVVAYVLLAA